MTPYDNVYRHPERQVHRSRAPEKQHLPLHDVYSLGVVFLEVGLGQPAADLFKMGKASQQKPTVAPTSSGATTATTGSGPSAPDLSSQAVFLDLAQRLLPETMGEAFAQVTRRCLSGKVHALSGGQQREWDGLTALSPKGEVTLSTAFWICVVEPLDALIEAMSLQWTSRRINFDREKWEKLFLDKEL